MKNIKITGAALLSKEEAETLLTQEERIYNKDWWLRSPGNRQDYATDVFIGGSVNYLGSDVYYDGICVRPALKIDIFDSDFKVGDTFTFGGKVFKVISPELAWMYKDDIGCCVFREDQEAPDANIYEASDVKKFIDNWFTSASFGKKLKTVYYGHHLYKYGTPVEEYELKIINKYFSNEDIRIINPATDIEQGRPTETIMTDCLSAVRNCDIFVFSSMSGVIGKGLYTEIQTALENGIPVYEIYGNTLNPTDNITFKLLNSDTPREYAVYNVFKGGPI